MGRGATIFDLDLVMIARWHKRGVWLVVLLLLGWIGMIAMTIGAGANQLTDFQVMVIWLLWLGLALSGVVFTVILMVVTRGSVVTIIVYGLLAMVMPPLVLLSVVSSTGRVLKLAGAKMGFAGVSGSELDKLRPGHCRGCGYDRAGLKLLEPCPECQREPLVI